MKISPENATDKYIATAPKEMQDALRELRVLIQKVAPTATERTDYFQMPGYSYDQYDYYNGMFVWFSYKKPYVRLHILPSVIKNHHVELKEYKQTKSIVCFKVDKKIPSSLIRVLVKESRNAMKALSKVKK